MLANGEPAGGIPIGGAPEGEEDGLFDWVFAPNGERPVCCGAVDVGVEARDVWVFTPNGEPAGGIPGGGAPEAGAASGVLPATLGGGIPAGGLAAGCWLLLWGAGGGSPLPGDEPCMPFIAGGASSGPQDAVFCCAGCELCGGAVSDVLGVVGMFLLVLSEELFAA